MYIESVPKRNSPPAILLRESYRDGGKIRKPTIANARRHDGRRGIMGGGTQASPTASDATKAYMDAADKTYGPLMEGRQAADPDIAFVRAMVAHRQGAIELAKVRVQFGKDDQTRKWADDIIRSLAAIDEMQAWLKQRSK